jgi:copper chaperone
MKVTLQIGGMECEDCVKAIREALEDAAGVESVKVDLAKGRAVIEGEEEDLDVSELIEIVEIEGYEAKAL